jgi:protein-S-isoprenylcysteine O-methyltransferase Ste14
MLDAEVLVLTLAFLSLYLFFRLKEPLKEKYGQGAYALAFKRFIVPGLTLIVIVLVRIRFIGGPMIPSWILEPVGTLLGWLLILVGVVLWVRAVQALGFDSLTMTYVYFPNEGKRTENAIYQKMRHPVYGAALRIALGLALLNGSWFAITLALLFGLYLWAWVRLVEEKELIERFGPSYAEYRSRIPAFWPRLRDVGGFIQFMIRGS